MQFSACILVATTLVLTGGFSDGFTMPEALLKGDSSSSSYASTVLTAAQKAIRRGTCLGRAGSLQCSATCKADGAESFYAEYTDGDTRYVITNGIPYHDITDNSRQPQACQNYAYMALPASPTITSYSDNGMGAIGIANTGGFIYNPLSSSSGSNDVAVLVEGDGFDDCNGHSDAKCFYHYHDDPTCLTSTDDCPHIGYLRDGVSVYGYCTIDGTQLASCYVQTTGDGYSASDYEYTASSDCQLDENNGYTFSDGSYGYVFTDTYPYTPPGYMATASDICFFRM